MKNVARLFILAAVAAAIPFAACGGESLTPTVPTVDTASAMPSGLPSALPSASASAPASASAVASAVPAPPTWKTMTKEERKDHMKKVVMPKMSAVFQSADAKKYADFSCVVCHGPDAKQGKFDMPNPKLPKLTMGTDPKKPFAKHKPEVVKFMMEKVVLEMATALGEAPFDPATKVGFGCHNCHMFTDAPKAAEGAKTDPTKKPEPAKK